MEGWQWCTNDGQALRFSSTRVRRLYRAITSDSFQLPKSWSCTSSIERDTLLKLHHNHIYILAGVILATNVVHKKKKMKGVVETGGVVSVLVKHENANADVQRILPKKCQDPSIFTVPCTIDNCKFANAMLHLRASINVMPTSVYRLLNFGDLELTRMVIQLGNRSVVQSLGIFKDILVQVNELIFPIDFYVLDMEDEASKEGSAVILG
ncbi:hypothetical protein CR513_08862, partial [Mucuna pruriens]